MTNSPKGKTIALDADGVLLDYSTAYAHAWAKAFGTLPELRDPQAYWPIDRWAVVRLSGERLATFRSAFDEAFWSTIPAIVGAVEACQQLVDAGYRLVCISALDEAYATARQRNLEVLGFPIADVVVTGGEAGEVSPKAAAVVKLQPLAFVDDYLPYHRGLPTGVHKALILRAPGGSPNVGAELAHVNSQHIDLRAFAEWWLGESLRDSPA
ncbi:HAD family hydrolase [Marilutibacter maris]|uniref:Phosphate acetyltransferase n=1 Tax=Marilutibacter maris TaxID=1605891 RepID=A0A2U9TDD8_9GAMM|nr:HAD family hydrolase [Lysobacter maris]AWV06250.1 phosphate acetyltransferase [Lysobacter maris]